MKNSLDNINIILPVKINYTVLDSQLQKRMVGEYIQVEKENGDYTRYAKILDASLAKSLDNEYDLVVEVKFRTLTSFYGNREGIVLVDACIDFDNERQEISISSYKLKVDSNNWFVDKSLQVIANTVVKNKLKEKMNFNLGSVIEEQLKSLNEKLNSSLEVSEGIFLSGHLENFKISEIVPQSSQLLVIVNIEGKTAVDIQDFNF